MSSGRLREGCQRTKIHVADLSLIHIFSTPLVLYRACMIPVLGGRLLGLIYYLFDTLIALMVDGMNIIWIASRSVVRLLATEPWHTLLVISKLPQ